MIDEIKTLGEAWVRYECASLAAGVSFYAALSIFPLMLVMVAAVGSFFRFMERGQDASVEIHATIAQQLSPEMADSLSSVFDQVQNRALLNGPLAGLMLLFGATLVFFQIDRAFYRIWDVRQRVEERGVWGAVRRMLVSRARSLGLVMGTCFLVVVVFVAGLALRTVMSVAQEWFPNVSTLSSFATVIISMAINLMVFFFLYRFLSKEWVDWRLCLKAGAVAAVLWECGGWVLGALSFGSNFSAYGLIGSFLAVLLWIYYSVMVLLLGAVMVRVGTRPVVDFRAKI